MQLQWRHSTGSASHHRSWVLPALGRHRRLCASLPQDRQPEPSRDVPAGEGEHDERGQTAPVTTTMGAAAAHADPSSSTNVGSSSGSVHASTPAQPAEAPSTSSAPAWQRHALALLGSAAAALSTALARLRDSPRWSQAQALRRLREAAEEDPGDPERHAALLAELNAQGLHAEALASIEARTLSTASSSVAVQYLRALVASGRLADYAPSSSSTNASSSSLAAAQASLRGGGAAPLASASAGSVAALGAQEDHRSLYQLLGELQAQVAREQPDLSPGASARRPLHIVVQGGGPGIAPARPLGPLQVLWNLLRTALFVLAIAFAWLVGSQAVRRASQPTTAASGTPATVTTIAGASSSGVPRESGPSVDPKEYKREELPEKSVKMFSDVRGCDEAKEELQEVVEFLKSPSKFTRLGAKLPKGVLLTGPPGTGKTLLARAVAGEAGVPFFYRAGSEFEELYVGVGARRMRALFAAAKKKAPCIVFIDEIDAIGGNRKHWENNTRRTLNQLLVEMDGFEANDGVIVIAATNLAETLDAALKRPGRFDRQVAVPLPDIKGRADILAYYLNDKPVDKDVDQELLAKQTQGFSGADISNLINEAALLAAKQDKDSISPATLDYAFDKISMGVERRSARRTPEGIKRTAVHEAGHALVAMCTPGASPVHKATVVPRGHALGMVTQVGREDEFSINRLQMHARIRVCMGGTVAEELVFGQDQVSSGATDDLRQATDMARYMVTRCGMNDVVGPQYIGGSDDKYGGNGGWSEETQRAVDGEVRRMLVEAREEVKSLLAEKIQDLHKIAAALQDRETLTRVEIEALLKPQPDSPPAATPPSSSGRGGQEQRRGEDEAQGQLEEKGAVPVAEAQEGTVQVPAGLGAPAGGGQAALEDDDNPGV